MQLKQMVSRCQATFVSLRSDKHLDLYISQLIRDQIIWGLKYSLNRMPGLVILRNVIVYSLNGMENSP